MEKNKTKLIIRFLRQNPYILVGGILVALFVFVAIFAPYLTDKTPYEQSGMIRLNPPSADNPMGTDAYGRDIMTRVFYGAQMSIQIGIAVISITLLLGGTIGLVAGYYPKIDKVIMRIIDGLMAFPAVIIAISIAAIWGAGMANVVFALSFAYFPRMARVARGSTLAAKELEFVEAGKAIGAVDYQLILKYILPVIISPIIVQTTFTFAQAILTEAMLSFFGIGISPPVASWGNMIADGRAYMTIAPWHVLYPGIAVFITVLGLNLLGDGMRDWLDPKLKN